MPFDMMPQPPAAPSDPRLAMLLILREIAAKSRGDQRYLCSCLYNDIMVDGRLGAWTERASGMRVEMHASVVQQRIGIPRLLSIDPIEAKRGWIDSAIAERRAELAAAKMTGELCHAA